jgi:3-methyladenine DNA glycosylase AlkD
MTAGKKAGSPAEQAKSAVTWLERHGTKRNRDAMYRYAIPSDRAFGVAMRDVQKLGKLTGRSHELALALWDTGWYEARLLTAYVDEPARVTASQMDQWAGAFDNWGVCDTLCFALWDRTTHAWPKVTQWSGKRAEYVKRAAFAMLWSLSVHDKVSGDQPFLQGLRLVEKAATDERNFVSKAVNMALRAVGKRNVALNAAAVTVARRLADHAEPAPRWVGKHALRELTSPGVLRRLRKS